ncbi:A24 family peptidase [Cupriavidus plantarum]|uniref:A24 family peptidase n=1 Tax=Cupriavidus plantarum TaxID=942865 RepID=UPI0015CEF3B7|nr:prepilin peptidase [Cupriavidus plantarum]NYH99278.1 prepilin peptidase CpaA [Cupriavidus plantarum]
MRAVTSADAHSGLLSGFFEPLVAVGDIARLGTFDLLTASCLLALVGTAAAIDLRSHRIPNRLVAMGAIAALVVQAALHGAAPGTWRWFTGLAAGIAPFVVLYLVSAVGAGDAKLMACVGAFVGPETALEILIATLLCGGAMAVWTMVARRHVRRTMAGVVGTLLMLPFSWRAGTNGSTHTTTTVTMTARLPYAVAIAGGVLLVMTGVI